MIETSFRLNKTPEKILDDLGFNTKLQYFFAYSCFKHMSPYVPMDTGMLFQTADVRGFDDHGEIHYLQSYAHRIYTGTDFNFQKTHHPLATAYWDKVSWLANSDTIINEVDEYRKMIAK